MKRKQASINMELSVDKEKDGFYIAGSVTGTVNELEILLGRAVWDIAKTENIPIVVEVSRIFAKAKRFDTEEYQHHGGQVVHNTVDLSRIKEIIKEMEKGAPDNDGND